MTGEMHMTPWGEQHAQFGKQMVQKIDYSRQKQGSQIHQLGKGE